MPRADQANMPAGGTGITRRQALGRLGRSALAAAGLAGGTALPLDGGRDGLAGGGTKGVIMTTQSQFKVVELTGPPRRMGRQYGEALSAEMRQALESYLALIGGYHQVPREDLLAQSQKMLPAAVEFDPTVIEYVRGQAEGSGLSLMEAFFLRSADEMLFMQNGVAAMCTSFAVDGTVTADGRPLLGQNVDWFLGTPCAVLKMRPDEGPPQLILALMGAAEYNLSAAGIGLCANGTASMRPGTRPGAPYLCYMPRVMRAPDLDGMRELMREANRGIAYFHFVDARGRMFGIESDVTGHQIIEPTGGVLVHSNHYTVPRFAEFDGAKEIFPDSYARLERITALVDERRGGFGLDDAKAILADHQGLPSAICRHPDPAVPEPLRAATLASFIMDPAERVMHVAAGNPCDTPYRTYAL